MLAEETDFMLRSVGPEAPRPLDHTPNLTVALSSSGGRQGNGVLHGSAQAGESTVTIAKASSVDVELGVLGGEGGCGQGVGGAAARMFSAMAEVSGRGRAGCGARGGLAASGYFLRSSSGALGCRAPSSAAAAADTVTGRCDEDRGRR
ncbi:hypothetical protein EYF80_002130 [Liparis tanakae]|uniref:Uncharacterized protein n=1 Tax=Liparis tanakae TaxID=230148 RepID=A0A4Z2JDF4_9TELE|nr:hypothetical protein EYF80_002130 [Liparis tanakae]